MALRFQDVMTRGDWIKLAILIVISGIMWGWVYIEYQKPFPTFAAEESVFMP